MGELLEARLRYDEPSLKQNKASIAHLSPQEISENRLLHKLEKDFIEKKPLPLQTLYSLAVKSSSSENASRAIDLLADAKNDPSHLWLQKVLYTQELSSETLEDVCKKMVVETS